MFIQECWLESDCRFRLQFSGSAVGRCENKEYYRLLIAGEVARCGALDAELGPGVASMLAILASIDRSAAASC